MGYLVEPLRLALPFGAFNGSSIVDPQMRPIEHHVIAMPVVKRSMDILKSFGTDIWLFSHDQWLIRNPDGEYVGVEQRAIRYAPTVVPDFAPYLDGVCKIVGASSDPLLLQRCEDAMQDAVGAEATAVRSQTFYLDITPPGHDKGTFVEAMARRLGIATAAVAAIGDMENDLPMFAKSGRSFAMGNAADEIKRHATDVTDTNEAEGFAKAVEMILAGQGSN
jgi:Cof subfamily protein (haloacid dehalogenase superfamily)